MAEVATLMVESTRPRSLYNGYGVARTYRVFNAGPDPVKLRVRKPNGETANWAMWPNRVADINSARILVLLKEEGQSAKVSFQYIAG